VRLKGKGAKTLLNILNRKIYGSSNKFQPAYTIIKASPKKLVKSLERDRESNKMTFNKGRLQK
jgi:hypothetical protein